MLSEENESNSRRKTKLRLDSEALEATIKADALNPKELVTALSERDAFDESHHMKGHYVVPTNERRRSSFSQPLTKLDISGINAFNKEGTGPEHDMVEMVTALSEREALQESYRSLAEKTRSTDASEGLPPLRSSSSDSSRRNSSRRSKQQGGRGSSQKENDIGEAPSSQPPNRRRSRQGSTSRLLADTAASRAHRAEKFGGPGSRSASSFERSQEGFSVGASSARGSARDRGLPPTGLTAGAAEGSSLPSIQNSARSNKEDSEPFCKICKQGFQSMSRLNNHVRFSAVHEINLKKQLESADLEGGESSGTEQEERLIYEGSKLFWRSNKNLDIHMYIAGNVVTIVAYCPEAQKEYPRLFVSLAKARELTLAKMQENLAQKEKLQSVDSDSNRRRRASNPIESGPVGVVKPKRRGSFMQQIEQEMAAAASVSRSLSSKKSLDNLVSTSKSKLKATDSDVSKFLLSRLEYVEADPAQNVEASVIITGPEDFGLVTKANPDAVKRGTKVPRRRRSTIEDYRKQADNFSSDIDGLHKHRNHAASLQKIVTTTMETLEALMKDGKLKSAKGKKRFRYAARRVMFNNAYLHTRSFLENKEGYKEWLQNTEHMRRHTSQSTPITPTSASSKVGF